jgi:hypothetical protein
MALYGRELTPGEQALPHGHSWPYRAALADANEVRDCALRRPCQSLIAITRRLYVGVAGVDLKETVYALDASTIDLCIRCLLGAVSLRKAAIKLHAFWICAAISHVPASATASARRQCPGPAGTQAGAFYVMDRGYIDFGRLHRLHEAGSFFVTQIEPQSNVVIPILWIEVLA